eukprot:augustus_masked-scaffold_15-processed-gene-4.4-mRNA-1 protein AED:0.48 eAED:0.48 QI:0/-1/0/1/-1/1/1/0/1650
MCRVFEVRAVSEVAKILEESSDTFCLTFTPAFKFTKNNVAKLSKVLANGEVAFLKKIKLTENNLKSEYLSYLLVPLDSTPLQEIDFGLNILDEKANVVVLDFLAKNSRVKIITSSTFIFSPRVQFCLQRNRFLKRELDLVSGKPTWQWSEEFWDFADDENFFSLCLAAMKVNALLLPTDEETILDLINTKGPENNKISIREMFHLRMEIRDKVGILKLARLLLKLEVISANYFSSEEGTVFVKQLMFLQMPFKDFAKCLAVLSENFNIPTEAKQEIMTTQLNNTQGDTKRLYKDLNIFLGRRWHEFLDEENRRWLPIWILNGAQNPFNKYVNDKQNSIRGSRPEGLTKIRNLPARQRFTSKSHNFHKFTNKMFSTVNDVLLPKRYSTISFSKFSTANSESSSQTRNNLRKLQLEVQSSHFDSWHYAQLLVLLKQHSLIHYIPDKTESGLSPVELCLALAQQGDRRIYDSCHLLESHMKKVRLRSNSGSLQRRRGLKNFSIRKTEIGKIEKKNLAYIEHLLSCKAMTPKLLDKFLKGMKTETKPTRRFFENGETVFEKVLILDLDQDVVAEMFGVLILHGFDISLRNLKGQNFLALLFNKDYLIDDFVCYCKLYCKILTNIPPDCRSFEHLTQNGEFLSCLLELCCGYVGNKICENDAEFGIQLVLEQLTRYKVHIRQLRDGSWISYLYRLIEQDPIQNVFVARLYTIMSESKNEFLIAERLLPETHLLVELLLQHVNLKTAEALKILLAAGYNRCFVNLDRNFVATFAEADVENATIKSYIEVVNVISDSFKGKGLKLLRLYQDKIVERLFELWHRKKGVPLEFVNALDVLFSGKLTFSLDGLDSDGILFRTRLLNSNIDLVQQWVLTHATPDKRYKIEEGAPIHLSESCKVVVAWDETERKNKVLKLIKSEYCFENEKKLRTSLRRRKKEYEKYILESDLKIQENYKRLAGRKRTVYEEFPFYAVMERGDRTLFDIMNREGITGRELKLIVRIAKNAARALKFMNDSGFVHGDFCPRNFLRTDYKKNVFKLIDLDCSVRHGKPYNVAGKASSAYFAPEVARVVFGQQSGDQDLILAGESLDVWSFGVTLMEMLCGIPLFLKDQSKDSLFVLETKVELVNWVSLSQKRYLSQILPYSRIAGKEFVQRIAFDLASLCLQADPDERPTFDTILNHPFFKINKLQNGREEIGESVRRNIFLRNKTFLLHPGQQSPGGSAFNESRNMVNHIFLSYMQREGSEIARNISYGVSTLGCSCWLDMKASKLTEEGMLLGVRSSKVFVMVLTTEALFRPFCLKELLWAIQYNKKILFVYENDSRFKEFVLKDFWEKWNSIDEGKNLLDTSLLSGQDSKSHMVPAIDRMDTFDHHSVEVSCRAESARSVLTSYLQQNLIEEKLIPYRRREYENKGMLQTILHEAGFVTPQRIMYNERKNDSSPELEEIEQLCIRGDYHILVLLPEKLNQASVITKDIVDFLKAHVTFDENDLHDNRIAFIEPGEDLPEHIHPADVLLILGILRPGFFSAHSTFLKCLDRNVDARDLKNIDLVTVEHNWFSQPEASRVNELYGVHNKIHNFFFRDSEAIPYRSLRKYENTAMKLEILKRFSNSLTRAKIRNREPLFEAIGGSPETDFESVRSSFSVPPINTQRLSVFRYEL